VTLFGQIFGRNYTAYKDFEMFLEVMKGASHTREKLFLVKS